MEQLKIDKALDHVIFREIKPEKNSIMGIAKVKISNEVQQNMPTDNGKGKCDQR